MNSYRHFSNKDCEYYPCHGIENQNCLFCFCPLYFIGSCGGDYKMINTIKDCSKCIKNHDENSYDFILKRLKLVFEEKKKDK
ncbi:MAG: hypothetical protein JG762_1093 [Deferribacteraceae bacterium]|jgi:hypothetical protein|nr:hypothetical protein [Deferribacteraceae bacterium]